MFDRHKGRPWALAAAAMAVVSASAAWPQSYPARPVRVIVPYPPGGGTDILARPIMAKVSERLGQQFLIDNRGGATGMVGTDVVAKAQGDGYTILLSASPAWAANETSSQAAVHNLGNNR